MRAVVFGICFACAAVAALAEENDVRFSFKGVEYFHRWSGGTQHEFTPAKQEDLDHWTDMFTINDYPTVNDAEKMANVANTVLGNYETAGGKIIKTSSVPASDKKLAEHFISVGFTRPEFAEAAFTRFKIVGGRGHSFVYSRRFYGDKPADQMDAWVKANGDKIEKALLDWDPPESALGVR